MTRLRQVAGVVLTVLALGYFVHFVVRTLTRPDTAALLTLPALATIVLTSFATSVSVVSTGWAWHHLLEENALPTRDLVSILGRTQIAKYLPGNVGHHLTRSALAIDSGIPLRAVARSLMLEAALLAGTGVGAGVLALPFIRPAWRRAVLADAFNFLLLGSALAGLAFVVSDPPLTTLPLAIGAFALSWVAGFLVPGAPAGLGVREGVLIALLSPSVDGALPIVLGFRLATTLGDFLSLGLGWALATEARPVSIT
jgi:hypothetical protein